MQAHHRNTCGACCTEIRNLGVTLGHTCILEGVNLHMHCGQLTGLIGPNGGGKTTLLRAMLGELPHTGELEFLPVGRPLRGGRPVIGYVPQRLDLDVRAPISVLDLFAAATARFPVWLGASRVVVEQAARSLELVAAGALLRRRLGQLSGGELQRVLLALALTPVPEILLLDEPVSGVDPAGLELFYQMVSHFRQQFDLAVLLISHDLPAVARVADRLVFLNRTVICEGPPNDVLAHPAVRRTFGFDFSQALPDFVPVAETRLPGPFRPREKQP